MSINRDHARLMRRATAAALATAILLALSKAVAWWLSGSVSLLAGLTDSLLDGAASLLNLLAVHYALRPADEDHRYGHGKAEALAGLAQALFNLPPGDFAAGERGIAVFNAPYSNTRSVAELVLAEAILLLRGIPEKNASCHRGGWIKSAANSFEIRGKKLGIIGYGSIGTQLSVLAEALGMQVFFYDVVTKLPLGNATQIGSLYELLGMCDRIYVMNEGRFVGELTRAEASQERIMALILQSEGKAA